MNFRPTQLDIYFTAIPMRSFEHASASRELSQAVVVRLGFDDGGEGWGESLPRQYVTGESLDSVLNDLEHILFPVCQSLDLSTAECLSRFPASAPHGRCINAAKCAIVTALSDRILNPTGRAIKARVSGVLGSANPAKTATRLRLMRLFGLRDFKLKLGFDSRTDDENLRQVHRQIGSAVAAGKCTLRVDVNGGWREQEAPGRIEALKQYGVCVVEQPVYCGAAKLVELAAKCSLPLMADESLLTKDDARALASSPDCIWWNIRLSKNGGIAECLDLAEDAAARKISFVIGAMVGESGILSAAQRRLLELSPPPRFVEGNYGRFLLRDDLTRPSPHFGYGGRLSIMSRPGLGIKVDPVRLAKYARLVRSIKA